MKEQEIKEASIFTKGLPQTHAQGMADRIAVGKSLRQRTARKMLATWTMAPFGWRMKEFQESVKHAPFIPAGAPLDNAPGKAGTNGWPHDLPRVDGDRYPGIRDRRSGCPGDRIALGTCQRGDRPAQG